MTAGDRDSCHTDRDGLAQGQCGLLPCGVPVGVKWVMRSVMGLALANFVASIWFAQYIVTGWLIALYVLGSFAFALMSMLLVD